MVGLFVRLKLAVLRGGIRGAGRPAQVGLAVTLVLAVTIGLTGALISFSARWASDDGAELATLGLFTAMLLIWVLGPLVSLGGDGTLDADRLNLLPLGGRDLVPGLCVASVIGGGGLTTILVLSGAAAGMATAGVGVVITIFAAALQMLVCIAASRVVSTSLAAARSRRWRDIALFVGPLLAVVMNLTFQVVSRNAQRFEEVDLGAARSLRWVGYVLPSGPPAAAMTAARRGELMVALVACVVGSLYLVALFAVWWRALQRTMTTDVAPTGPRRVGQGDLFPAALRFLPRSRVGAIAAKEIRLTWRDPRQRAALLGSLFPAVLIGLTSGIARGRGSSSVLYGAAVVFSLGASTTNLFGFDGPRHWINVAAGEDIGADLTGKVLARLLIALPLGLVATLGLALRAGSFALVPASLGLSAFGLGLTLGSGAWSSVAAAYPMPDSSNPWAGGQPGHTARFMGPSTISFFGSAAVMAPFIGATLFLRDRPAQLVPLIALECVCGLVAWNVGLNAAVRRSQDRQPELLEALAYRRG